MGRQLKTIMILISLFLLLTLVADSLFVEQNLLIQNACAPNREHSENITIPANDIASLNLAFNTGDELELIFGLTVKQDLPISVWFVNYANYVRLVDGNEFLFYIDGSKENIKTASMIVSVTQKGSYVLVLTNNNNETVDVFLNYDVNTYPEEADTSSSGSEKGTSIPLWKEFYIMLPLGLVIGILAGFLISRKISRTKKSTSKPGNKVTSKKNDIKKRKKKTPKKKPEVKKVKKKKPVVNNKTEPEDLKELDSEEGQTDTSTVAPSNHVEEPKAKKEGTAPQFCGNCGKLAKTKFCPYCGKET